MLAIFLYYRMSNQEPSDVLGISYVFVFSIMVLLADFLLQAIISDYKKLLLVESISLPIIIILVLLA
jgi:hypothetical protein